MTKYTDNDRARFFAKVQTTDDPNGCHPWTAGKSGVGYGQFQHTSGKLGAHRVAYELAHGPLPEGVLIRHACDNPPCVNPAHLVAGTHADNRADLCERWWRLSVPDVLTPTTMSGIMAFHDAGLTVEQIAQVMSLRLRETKRWLRQGQQERASNLAVCWLAVLGLWAAQQQARASEPA